MVARKTKQRTITACRPRGSHSATTVYNVPLQTEIGYFALLNFAGISKTHEFTISRGTLPPPDTAALTEQPLSYAAERGRYQ